VQPGISITVYDPCERPPKEPEGVAEMRIWFHYGHETAILMADTTWTEAQLYAEARDRWPDIKPFGLRYDGNKRFKPKANVSVQVTGKPEKVSTMAVPIRYGTQSWSNRAPKDTTPDEIELWARQEWSIPQAQPLVVRADDGGLPVHLGAE
jgi:hypothetical protein